MLYEWTREESDTFEYTVCPQQLRRTHGNYKPCKPFQVITGLGLFYNGHFMTQKQKTTLLAF